MSEELKVYLRLDEELAERFFQIKKYLGLKNDTEVLRSLINWYWNQYQEKFQPSMVHFNISEQGVSILDRTIDKPRGRVVDVYFKPDNAWCEWCQATNCKHVKFALEIPEVQKILREKGWRIRVT